MEELDVVLLLAPFFFFGKLVAHVQISIKLAGIGPIMGKF